MPTTETNRSSQPTDATMKQFVSALNDIATALARNTEQLQSVQRSSTNAGIPGGGPGDRSASIEQARTTLDYQVLSQLMGRRGFTGFTVRAQLQLRGNDVLLKVFDLPPEADKVAVHVDGVGAPEVIEFDDGPVVDVAPGGGSTPVTEQTVVLNASARKTLSRIEIQNVLGVPIRLGPRLTFDSAVPV
ncbi:hypothetical protein [Tenggerimyces flavus]|uniref:Uncharacterized protein n=1 Tax=Tenggerimyces flavus TaxID=1708749 RepID=A0ABV7YPK5_9ACTN|nr:hypothetical protein [Tenggerimyces flavus]MBM7784423.1 hypothetical protein [Tenggerimyces flavus]